MLWVKINSMQTIQIVLDEALLRAADRAARRHRLNRSALFREALREHLKRLALRDQERRDRAGYEGQPEAADEVSAWDTVIAWPDE